MKLVYICSPLRGEPEKKHSKGERIRQRQFLNDEVSEERSLGQEMGKALLCRCDELLVCGSIISEGMREEIKIAYENGITVLGRDLSIADIEERLGSEGRVLVRKSGTEPLLRVMVEAQTDELCEECVLHIINAMKGVSA